MAGVISVIGPERRIEIDPYDIEAWNLLVRDAQRRPVEHARHFYEKLVGRFPNAGRYWKTYIEHEMKAKCFENVENLFKRCLIKILNIDLWKCYLNYVRETKGSLVGFRESMAKAYDYAIDHVGLDMHSYQIYADYIAFLGSVPAVGPYAENQKIAAIRKVYHRGIVTPLFNVEGLWSEYCTFEKRVNVNLAEKLIMEKNKDYQNARRVVKAMESVVRGINRQAISVPPKATAAVLKQVDLWKRYIQWENGNPLNADDYAIVTKRVVYAYEQALLCLGYHADFWYEAALFMQEASKTLAEKGDTKQSVQLSDDIAAMYDRATSTVLRENMLLYFAYADYEEGRMKYDKVQAIYNKLLDMKSVDPTLAYVQYMKFSRRTEGIKAARAIFKRAREDGRSKSQVYVAAALMEYYCSKDTSVAFKIFELGLKKFGSQPEYALAYIDFLSHLNEDNNTRVLFERILTSGNLPSENSLEVWDRYLEFESLVGDLSSILKVDKRRREALDKEFSSVQTLLLIDRYKFMDLLPCSADELRSLGYTPNLLSKSLLTNDKFSLSALAKGTNGATSSTLDDGYPRPDLNQMIPFKPKIAPSSYHPVAGGIFPVPPAVAHFLTLLPPPHCFNGPFVGVDALMTKIREMTLPDEAPIPSTSAVSRSETENGGQRDPPETGRMMEIKKEFYHLLATTVDPAQVLNQDSRKRALPRGDSDDESGDASASAPVHDIYRSRRQLKKTAK